MITYVLHDADSLLGLGNELVLSLLDLGPRLLAQVVLVGGLARRLARQGEGRALGARLGGIQAQARVLNVLASACSELDVGVECSTPAREEAALDLCVLRKTSLANLLAGDGVLLEGRSQRVLARAGLLGCKRL